jgi:transcriptional regulator with PAS, ATPase and Fis domain
VRVLAAANADVDKALEEGRFRSDLYYRLATVTLAIPPLRERTGDIPLLIQIHPGAGECRSGAADARNRGRDDGAPAALPVARKCARTPNAIQRSVILSRDRSAITVNDLPPKLAGLDVSAARTLREAVDRRVSLDDLGHDYIRAILDSVNGNKTEPAQYLANR